MSSIRTMISAWLTASATLLVTGCVTPYTANQQVDASYAMSVGDGVRLAAKAMLAVSYFPTEQNDVTGRVVGERSRKDSLSVDVFTLYIEAIVSQNAAGALDLKATCSISKNMAYTDILDDECKKFRKAFDKLLAERSTVPKQAPPQKEAPRKESPQKEVRVSPPLSHATHAVA